MIYAGFWIRLLAYIFDLIILQGGTSIVEYLISTPLHLSPFVEQMVGVVPSIIFTYLYYVEIPLRRGTTIGKSFLGIYVLDAKTGEIFSRKQAIIRMLSYLLSYLIVGCGFLMAAFHPQKLCLHDLIAGTVSVRRKKWKPGAPEVQVTGETVVTAPDEAPPSVS